MLNNLKVIIISVYFFLSSSSSHFFIFCIRSIRCSPGQVYYSFFPCRHHKTKKQKNDFLQLLLLCLCLSISCFAFIFFSSLPLTMVIYFLGPMKYFCWERERAKGKHWRVAFVLKSDAVFVLLRLERSDMTGF